MEAITILRANSMDHAINQQKSTPSTMVLSEKELSAWRDLESFLGNDREYFNSDDGNIWMIADRLFLYKVSAKKPVREKVRIVGILRENKDSKELIFDSEMFDDNEEHRKYARANNLLLV